MGEHQWPTLPINGGATWFYEATRNMSYGERCIFRAMVAHPDETRSLVTLIGLAVANLLEQQPQLVDTQT